MVFRRLMRWSKQGQLIVEGTSACGVLNAKYARMGEEVENATAQAVKKTKPRERGGEPHEDMLPRGLFEWGKRRKTKGAPCARSRSGDDTSRGGVTGTG